MAGNPSDRTARARTVLEHLLWKEDRTYEEMADRFERLAAELGERATISPRHLRRLASGERRGTTPVTRRVLQAMFGQPVEQLLSAFPVDQDGSTTELRGCDSGPPDSGQPDSGLILDARNRKALEKSAARAHDFVFTLSNTNMNGETMDQLYDDVAGLAASYQKQPLATIVGRLIATQDQIFTLLEGRQPPFHTRRLLLLAGVTSGLLAKISHDLADSRSAMTQTRTAFLCADNADHDGMRAWIRGLQSLISYWAGRYHEAVRYAQQGSHYAPIGTTSVWLPLNEARAWAALGNSLEAHAAISRAEDARGRTQPDEVDELGGLCTFSLARQLYYTADALVWLPAESATAEDYAQRAVRAYSDSTAADWGFGDAAGSATDLALARLHGGEFEGATEALEPVLTLPSDQRIHGIIGSVNHVYASLTTCPSTVKAKELQERIEAFTAAPVQTLGPRR